MQTHAESPNPGASVGGASSARSSRPSSGGRAIGGSLLLGRIAGIRIYVHATFLMLLVWIGGSRLLQGDGMAAAVDSVAFIMSVFAIVVVHELGHALMARRFGIGTRDITLLPIGGVARLEKMPRHPAQEFLIAVAGPAVNVVLAAVLYIICRATETAADARLMLTSEPAFLAKLMWVNVSLAVFNLLPAFPMDGGRALRAVLATRMGRERATTLAAGAGKAMSVVFGIAGVLANPMLLLIALFVWAGARYEASIVRMEALFRGVSLRHAMLTDVFVLPPEAPLSSAVERMVAGGEPGFPIVSPEGLVGVLTRSGILRALDEPGRHTTVASAMGSYVLGHPDEPVQTAVDRSVEEGVERSIVVVDDGRIVGIATPETIADALLMQRVRSNAS